MVVLLVLAVLGAYAWVLCGPVVLMIIVGLPLEAAADWLRRRRRRATRQSAPRARK